MTSSMPETYPQYCFHLSPTINRWCHFKATDIQSLQSHSGFQGQDVYFHKNHPIKWVRVAGIVVAVDEYHARRVYTVDDSSGATIECVVNVPPSLQAADKSKPEHRSKQQPDPAQPTNTQVTPGEIRVGQVIDVKGTVRTFRDMKQIVAEKIIFSRSTEEEIHFWERLIQLRDDILSKPWLLEPDIVRRCRKAAQKDGGGDERMRRKRMKRKASEVGDMEHQGRDSHRPRRFRAAGLEKVARESSRETESSRASRNLGADSRVSGEMLSADPTSDTTHFIAPGRSAIKAGGEQDGSHPRDSGRHATVPENGPPNSLTDQFTTTAIDTRALRLNEGSQHNRVVSMVSTSDAIKPATGLERKVNASGCGNSRDASSRFKTSAPDVDSRIGYGQENRSGVSLGTRGAGLEKQAKMGRTKLSVESRHAALGL